MRGPEAERSHNDRLINGFYEKYMSGQGLDIGYSGGAKDADPVLQTATGIDLNYKNYDGTYLPFTKESQDYVFSSHCLEHIDNYKTSLQEWFRVLKINGHLVIAVPHKFLYEKKQNLPSRYNRDHKRFYTPASLLNEIEESLTPNSYRIVHLRDNADGYDYSILPEKHCGGACEIELVVKKIEEPDWQIK